MNFFKAAIRGAGNELGRSAMRTITNPLFKGKDANYVRVNGSVDKPSKIVKRDFEISSNFDLSNSNRAGTVESKMFNMVNEFGNQIDQNVNYILEDIETVVGKFNDVRRLFEFKEYDTKKIDKLFSTFEGMVEKGMDKFKQHHATQVEVKQIMLRKYRIRNGVCVMLGIVFVIPLFFIKGTKLLKSQIEAHKKLMSAQIRVTNV